MSKAAKFKASLKVEEMTERQARAEHKRLGEEIARMLAGAEITAEARAAAERLLKAAS